MASFAPKADLRSGRGRTASFTPTAFPTKGNCKEFACHSIRGRLYRSKPIALQKRERKKSTVPTRHPENSSEKHRRTQPWEFPGLGPCCLLGKSLPLYFRLANGYRAVLHGTCNILRGRAASFAPTAGTQCLPRLRLTSGRDAPTAFPEKAKLKRVCFPLHRGNPTEAISQSSRHNA